MAASSVDEMRDKGENYTQYRLCVFAALGDTEHDILVFLVAEAFEHYFFCLSQNLQSLPI